MDKEDITTEQIDEIGRQIFEKANGRPFPWEGLQPWMISFAKAVISKQKENQLNNLN